MLSAQKYEKNELTRFKFITVYSTQLIDRL